MKNSNQVNAVKKSVVTNAWGGEEYWGAGNKGRWGKDREHGKKSCLRRKTEPGFSSLQGNGLREVLALGSHEYRASGLQGMGSGASEADLYS